MTDTSPSAGTTSTAARSATSTGPPTAGCSWSRSDRISAFDFVLDTPIPDKGRILTAMAVWWFERLPTWCPTT